MAVSFLLWYTYFPLKGEADRRIARAENRLNESGAYLKIASRETFSGSILTITRDSLSICSGG